MHLPLSINSVFNIKHPPWSTFRTIGERNMNTKTDDDFESKYDLLLLDSKNFVVQTINDNKSQKLFTQFGKLNVVKISMINMRIYVTLNHTYVFNIVLEFFIF